MKRWLDCAFAVGGTSVGRDYPTELYEALRRAAPWLDEEPQAGVHPLKGLTPAAGLLLIGGRSRLLLRIPEARLDESERLQGRQLDLPAPLQLGQASPRELLAHPVLHARLVITGPDDEGEFVTDVERSLAELELDCEFIVGRRGELAVGGAVLAGFSLMLHGLSPAESLAAQTRGLGLHRKLGCGLFVPHKSVAAVAL